MNLALLFLVLSLIINVYNSESSLENTKTQRYGLRATRTLNLFQVPNQRSKECIHHVPHSSIEVSEDSICLALINATHILLKCVSCSLHCINCGLGRV